MPPKVDKRTKLFNSRTIRTENADPNLKEGVLEVPEFLAAREFEIRSMEMAQLKSKYASSTRCFQSLPRSLRRRTASHNVKRIPKRLRNRAIREMQNSNGVPAKPKHPTGRELYRLKMSTKLLKLASRIKLMRSTPELKDQKVNIRKQIKMLNTQVLSLKQSHGCKSEYVKLNNKVGSYDNTGVNKLADRPKGNIKYCKRQQDFVWLPTHIWHAKRAHLVKRYGYQIPLKPTQKCYKSNDRASRGGAIMFDTSYYDTLIVTITDLETKKSFIESLIGSKFISKLLNGEKSYEGWLYINSVTFGKGVVFCWGSDVLIRVFPSLYEELFEYVLSLKFDKLQDCRYSIGSIDVSGPKALQSLAKIFHINQSNVPASNWLKLASFLDSNSTVSVGTTFSFSIDDPRKWKSPSNFPQYSGNFNDLLIDIQNSNSTTNKIDSSVIESLFSSEGRELSYEDQMSIKELSVSQTQLSSKVYQIPLLVTKLATGWCVMLPWYWVLPVWFQLSKVTDIKLGGLDQRHQINFQSGRATYPVDYPFLRDGYLDNEFILSQNTATYNLKPSSHKTDYNKLGVEYDNFHGCDWRFLQLLTLGLKWYRDNNGGKPMPRKVDITTFNDKLEQNLHSIDDLLQLIRGAKYLDDEKKARGELLELPVTRATGKFDITISLNEKFPPLPIKQVKFDVIGKGNPSTSARIYRFVKGATETESLRNSLQVENQIGYVTSGSFNLKLGSGSGIGCISGLEEQCDQVVIRNVGCTVPMLAKCTII